MRILVIDQFLRQQTLLFTRFNAFSAAVGIQAELDQESSLCSARSQSLQKVG